jgi:hypothetical protein
VRSSVRAAIDEDFRNAGIVIAFPQRDVHIDMNSPLEVRLKNDKDETLTSEKSGDSRIISGVHRLRRVGGDRFAKWVSRQSDGCHDSRVWSTYHVGAGLVIPCCCRQPLAVHGLRFMPCVVRQRLANE